MVEFISFRNVAAAKQHVCEQCRKPILKGERHLYVATKFDGYFSAYREHFECRAAWCELNFDLRDYPPGDGAPFLIDDGDIEAGEKDWMREKHPLVAERMGWSSHACLPIPSIGADA